MLCAAASGGTNNLSLSPFPNIEVTTKNSNLEEKIHKFPDAPSIIDLIQKIPSAAILTNWAKENKLKQRLEESTGSPLAAPLILWLICTNRCFMKKLKPKDQPNGNVCLFFLFFWKEKLVSLLILFV